jgi:gliding motility-associated-like protein
LILTIAANKVALAQCPPNLDFELGNFTGWEAWVGNVAVVGGINTITWAPNAPVTPTFNRHTMLRTVPGNGLDYYGGFPRNCPNGSGSSIQLGNDSVQSRAEGVSYTFTIPAWQNEFNLTYFYAIVLHEGSHTKEQQARLNITVENLTDLTPLPCPLEPFIVGTTLEGFLPSGVPPRPPASSGTVWYKDWAAASIKLNNLAGKTIRVFFQTADCTASGHFGYAYLDIASQCSSAFIGAAYCPDDTSINVTAPFGYQTYEWWNINDPSTILATTQTINFTPPPPAGTILQVAVTPYSGYGCPDVYTAQLLDTLSIFANAGSDKLSCEKTPVQLGGNSTPGFVYSWDPVTGLSDPTISNPIATPSVTTTYVLTVRNFGGGCLTTDTVTVKAAVLDTTVNVTGFLTGCITPANPTVLKVGRGVADSIQWYRNNNPIPGANDTVYNVVQTGSYHVTLFSFQGCNLSSTDINITVNPTPVVGFNTNDLVQCFNGHQFNFTNTSTIAFGTMDYSWDMGDASPIQTTRDVSYSYADTGVYTVRLIVTSDQGCIDSVSYTVVVYESPFSAFDANTRGVCQKINDFIFTNKSTLGAGFMTWVWDYGDGNTDTTLNGRHYYAQPGTYNVRLTAVTNNGCPNDSTFTVTVFPEPVVGFTEPNAEQCFGNNQFNFINTSTVLTGDMQYVWYLGDGASTTTRDVTYSYAMPGEYMVKMVARTDSGCVDSIAKNIKIFKYAIADFKVDPVCVNMRLPLLNQTINTSPSVLTYLWEFGNGATSTLENPVYSYPAPGNYNLKLTVSNVHCPLTLSEKQVNITIDEPLPGTRYPDVEAVMNFPEQLQARQIANTVLWTPSVNLDFANSYRPSFKGLTSQLYQVQLKTKTGCVTVDTQFVKIKKKIEVYVPTIFTPDGNGLNDYLYPVLMGFKTLNYFRVYDRWGKLLFQSKTERPGWDGRLKGDGVSTQTVVWMVEAVDVDGVTHQRQGTTIILR